MAIRMSGMVSNLDTDSIIKEMMKAQSQKKVKLENKKTKLTWQQEKWQELNKKIYALYTDSLSKLRLQGNYSAKKVTSSNEAKVEVTAANGAPEGSHSISIKKLASSQYVTSDKLTQTGITSSSKLVADLGIDEGTMINITTGTGDKQKTVSFDIDKNTTVAGFLQKLKDAGLNASFDEKQGRFFISSKQSGKDGAFTITSSTYDSTNNPSGAPARTDIKKLVNYEGLSFAQQASIDDAMKTIQDATNADLDTVLGAGFTVTDDTPSNLKKLDAAINTILEQAGNYATGKATNVAVTETKDRIKQAIIDGTEEGGVNYSGVWTEMSTESWTAVEDKYKFEDGSAVTFDAAKAAADKVAISGEDSLDADEKKAYAAYKDYESILNKKIDARVNTDIQNEANQSAIKDRIKAIQDNGYTQGETTILKLADITASLTADFKTLANSSMIPGTADSSALKNLGLGEIDANLSTSGKPSDSNGKGMVIVAAGDSEIELDGAVLTGTSNTIVANGLTINLKGTTAADEKISLNVSNNTQATYDMIKDFVTKYNELLKEMNKLYYADSARGYEPLTDEERESMSDDQIEKWETKIKDSLLRRDDSLGSLTTAMKTALASSVEVNGKTYSLSTFGIQTSTDYTEKGLLHIFGDKSDPVYSEKTDKLMAALQEDPEAVATALSGIFTNLYETMTDKMKSTTLSSALTFYNDKQMAKTQDKYKKDIATMEKRLKEIEDRYYKQFSAMETAMSKLNSQSSALAGFFGQSQ